MARTPSASPETAPSTEPWRVKVVGQLRNPRASVPVAAPSALPAFPPTPLDDSHVDDVGQMRELVLMRALGASQSDIAVLSGNVYLG
jgi:hypothetical protein